jgi:hypothetical protein
MLFLFFLFLADSTKKPLPDSPENGYLTYSMIYRYTILNRPEAILLNVQ